MSEHTSTAPAASLKGSPLGITRNDWARVFDVIRVGRTHGKNDGPSPKKSDELMQTFEKNFKEMSLYPPSVSSYRGSYKGRPRVEFAVSYEVNQFIKWLKESVRPISDGGVLIIVGTVARSVISSAKKIRLLSDRKIDSWYETCNNVKDIIPLISADFMQVNVHFAWPECDKDRLFDAFCEALRMIMYPSREGLPKSVFDNDLLDHIRFHDILTPSLTTEDMMCIYVSVFKHQMARIPKASYRMNIAHTIWTYASIVD